MRLPPKTLNSPRNAFTFTEVLLVLVITAALVALLLPAYQSARRAAQKVRCAGNLRALYSAMLAFTEDYNGCLPPTLGPAVQAHRAFVYNQYWWGQAYLGRYAVGPLTRPRDSTGRLTQEDAEIYNCPARFADRPDTPPGNGTPSISYTMASFYTKDASTVPLTRSRLRMMENKSQTLLLTEGRGMSLYRENTETLPLGSSGARGLRRFHQGALNLLFLDGHVESFSGPDQEIVALHPR